MEISLPFPAHTLLKMIVVKRTKLRIVRLTFLALLLCSAFVATATADDTKPDAAPAKPAEKDATQIKKEGAEPKTEAAVPGTEDPKAKLLAMFKKEESITNTLGMVMVWVPKGYRVSRYEVTQRDFEQIMKQNPAKFKGDSRPVENVTLDEAGEFCKKLTEKEQAEGKLPKTFSYALPSEEQNERTKLRLSNPYNGHAEMAFVADSTDSVNCSMNQILYRHADPLRGIRCFPVHDLAFAKTNTLQ